MKAKENNHTDLIDQENVDIAWSLIGSEVSDVEDLSVNAVTKATGTATHHRDQPKDLHVDDC